MKTPVTTEAAHGRQPPVCRDSRHGQALLEISLMMPWILFLFIAVFDFGFYMYAVINTQNAARVAALYTSSSPSVVSDSTGACTYVLGEMNGLPNVRSLSSCSGDLTVTAQSIASGSSPDGSAASRVTVAYTTVQLIPIPWLAGKIQISRTVEMRASP